MLFWLASAIFRVVYNILTLPLWSCVVRILPSS